MRLSYLQNHYDLEEVKKFLLSDELYRSIKKKNKTRMLERASFNRSNNFKNNIDHGKKNHLSLSGAYERGWS